MDLDKCRKDSLDALGIPAELYDELVRDFVPEADESLAELLKALEGGDLETARHAAHKIRGGAGNLRIEEIQLPAGEIEDACEDAGNIDAIRKNADLLAGAVADLKGLVT
jgi:HPt (histidine-containing phosphotransfer) domain-containing protein